MMTRTTRTTTCWRAARYTAAALVLFVTSGCRQAPITENDERTQFDRYDLVRDEYAPAYLEDEYGRKRPNLRGRLIGRR
ncbi:MAG: hypothetical protein K8E66_12195 [Phycisphaerales bacterium]|nr:hypothetical protein [Phycisphaerales bacterium]